MGYSKIVEYGNYLELYQYEKNISDYIRNGFRGSKVSDDFYFTSLASDREGVESSRQRTSLRRGDNIQRAKLEFNRLVKANFTESESVVLASFTYAESVTELGQGREDFNAFIRNLRNFCAEFRYICVSEWQRNGRLHFHCLFWSSQIEEFARTERQTRLFARLWRRGFVDLRNTDNSEKLVSYLSKYMVKTFSDSRLRGMKAYVCSRNIFRPKVSCNPLLTPYYYGELVNLPSLSTARLLKDVKYDTIWLGQAHYSLYQINNKIKIL